MSKKNKKAPAGLSFSGALSATIRFLPKDGTSDTSIPEQYIDPEFKTLMPNFWIKNDSKEPEQPSAGMEENELF